jgi:Ca-activated chloride channel family protein
VKFFWILVAAGCLPLGAQDDTLFRSDVRLVNVLATVQDENGNPIGGLEKKDFRILDEGVEREIAVFERRTDRPLSIVLLVDTSMSTGIELKYEREAAKRFAAQLLGPGAHPDDRLAVMKFSEGVDMLVDFSRTPRNIERAIDRLKAEYGTSLYDGVLLASEELEPRGGRHVIIAISDGSDTTSYTSFGASLEAAHSADAVVFSLIVRPVKADAGRNVGGENTLKMFASNTGGLTFIEYSEEGIDRAFGEILENLRTQYLLGYYPPEHTDPKTRFRKIGLEVNVPHQRVLARAGYYVPEERKLLPESIPPDGLDVTPKKRGGWREAEPSQPPK